MAATIARSSAATIPPSTALSDACKSGSYAFVQSKINRGEKPDANTLTLACGSRVVAIVNAVILTGAQPNEETLTVACSTGIKEIVEKAISAGAKVTPQTLTQANTIGNRDILALLQNVPRINFPAGPLSPQRPAKNTFDDHTPGKFDIVDSTMVNRSPIQDNRLLKAANSGNAITLRASLDAGAEPLEPGAQFELNAACKTADLASVELLLSRVDGIIPGPTTLTIAFRSGNLAIVDQVRKLNAQPDADTFNTALKAFIGDRSQACAAIDKAIAAGAKPNSETLHTALQQLRQLPANYSLHLLVDHLHQKGGAKPSEGTLTLACKTLYLPEFSYFSAYDKLLASTLKTGAKPDTETWESIHWYSSDGSDGLLSLSDNTLNALFASGLKPSESQLLELQQQIVIPSRIKQATPIKETGVQARKNEIFRNILAKAHEALTKK